MRQGHATGTPGIAVGRVLKSYAFGCMGPLVVGSGMLHSIRTQGAKWHLNNFNISGSLTLTGSALAICLHVQQGRVCRSMFFALLFCFRHMMHPRCLGDL